MSDSAMDAGQKAARDWWRTEVIEISPGIIRMRGYPVEQLIGRIDFPQMIWLMLRGALPSKAEADLLTATLVASVDHGPQAPSIAIARMAATCGVGINNAMASAINVLGDVHGGAGEQAMMLYSDIAAAHDEGEALAAAAAAAIDAFFASGEKFVPGFGHRFHPVDPRAPRLLELVDAAAKAGTVRGHFAAIGRAVEADLMRRKGKRVPMNIDGVSAVVFAELGFPPPLGRGLFILSRAVGILAHAWEQTQQGGRNKGPIPPEFLYTYAGASARAVDKDLR
ncbi:MAG TPA: citryl-CoA lyase [Alphaproteobacteria bacterium]|nr:citryl-CoA lyase [Alphaproteobacteria bacterium]